MDEAEQIARELYDRALAEDDEWLRPRGASAMGVVALMRGRPRTATRFFRITVASLNELDGQYLAYNLSFLARGAALAGFVDEARQALLAASDSPRFPLFEADWMIAEAALLAAEGTLDAATEQALRAARQAASLGEWAIVGIAAHDAARYTAAAEAVQLAATAAERIDGPVMGAPRRRPTYERPHCTGDVRTPSFPGWPDFSPARPSPAESSRQRCSLLPVIPIARSPSNWKSRFVPCKITSLACTANLVSATEESCPTPSRAAPLMQRLPSQRESGHDPTSPGDQRADCQGDSQGCTGR